MNVKIPQPVFQDLLFYSFRYALGRRTYITGQMSDLLLKYKKHMRRDQVHQIIDEIEAAIDAGHAGSEKIDVPIWTETVLELLNE